MEKKQDGRRNNGGARPGAGRKYKERRLMHLNIDKPNWVRLKGTPNASNAVNEALKDYFAKH